MVNLIQQASEELRDFRNESTSVEVKYSIFGTNPAIVIDDLLASLGTTNFRVMDDAGNYRILKSKDFKIDRELLVYNESEVTPVEGDRIEWNNAIYEVLCFNDEPHWRWTSQYHVTRRIHTKKVKNL